MNFRILLFSSLLGMNCMSSLHQFHSSDPIQLNSLNPEKKIQAQSEQFVILGFVYDTKYVDDALSKLQSQCPKGSIERIDTVFKTRLGFLSWTNEILLTGYCIDSGKK